MRPWELVTHDNKFLNETLTQSMCFVRKVSGWRLLDHLISKLGLRCELLHHNDHFNIRTMEIRIGVAAGYNSKGINVKLNFFKCHQYHGSVCKFLILFT